MSTTKLLVIRSIFTELFQRALFFIFRLFLFFKTYLHIDFASTFHSINMFRLKQKLNCQLEMIIQQLGIGKSKPSVINGCAITLLSSSFSLFCAEEKSTPKISWTIVIVDFSMVK